MKTKLFILSILLSTFSLSGYAAYPIPSYNVPVYHIANFQEKSTYGKSKGTAKEKRNLIIRISGYGGPNCSCTVWVYSLDGRDVIGPDTVGCNVQLSYEIDERDWGVIVECDDHVTVDVWTEPGGDNPLGEAKMPDELRHGLLTGIMVLSGSNRF